MVRPLKHPANSQLLPQLVVVGLGEFLEPLVQPLAHFTSGFLGEGDRQDFLRTQFAGRRLEQRPHDAGHQHPGFASASAGFHRHAAARVTGNGVEGFSAARLAVALVGGIHAVFQKSLRHRPLALQYSHDLPSPSAGSTAPSAMRDMSLKTLSITPTRMSLMAGWS